MIKFCKIFLVLVLIFSVHNCAIANDVFSKVNVLNYISSKYHVKSRNLKNVNVVKNDYSIIIKVNLDPPENHKLQKQEALLLFKKHLKLGLTKSAVVWQKNEYSYGKTAVISGNYINQYLNRKLSESELIKHITLSAIEPVTLKIKKLSTISLNKKEIYEGALLRQKADLYRGQGQLEQAIRMYKQAINKNCTDTLAMYSLAEIYKKQKLFKKAKIMYIKVLEVDPDFISAHNGLKFIMKLERVAN